MTLEEEKQEVNRLVGLLREAGDNMDKATSPTDKHKYHLEVQSILDQMKNLSPESRGLTSNNVYEHDHTKPYLPF